MDRADAEGAAAAAEYFLDVYEYMMATHDTEEWQSMSHAECGYCSATLEKVEWLKSANATFRGGEISLKIPEPGKYGRDEQTGIFPFDGLISQSALQVLDESGVEIASERAASLDARIEVGRHAESWVIVEIAPQPTEES